MLFYHRAVLLIVYVYVMITRAVGHYNQKNKIYILTLYSDNFRFGSIIFRRILTYFRSFKLILINDCIEKYSSLDITLKRNCIYYYLA